MQFMSVILLISCIGFIFISILTIVTPEKDGIIYPLTCMLFSFIIVGSTINEINASIQCKTKIEGTYCGLWK